MFVSVKNPLVRSKHPTHLVERIFLFFTSLCRRLLFPFPLAVMPSTALQSSLLPLIVIPTENGRHEGKHLKPLGVVTRSAEELKEYVVNQATGVLADGRVGVYQHRSCR